MGVDLLGVGRSYNCAAWREFYEIGIAFGWKPKGTLPPVDYPEEWCGTYFSNDLQIVSAEDARAWAAAIRKFLRASDEEIPEHLKFIKSDMTDAQRVLHNLFFKDSEEKHRRYIEDFATVAEGGELTLG